MPDEAPFRVGFLVFPDVTQLDLTGPWEVLSSMPRSEVLLVGRERGPVRAMKGLVLQADCGYDDCPPLDLVCVPGGPGVNALMEDAATLAFLRRTAATARFVTAVCTGSLVLGAAGLLAGRRAACHWTSRDMLSLFGATPVDARVEVDGPVITGGGVTAGIDFALTVAALLHGETLAQAIQLGIEYDPAPPFAAGSPAGAPKAVLDLVSKGAAPMLAARRAAAERAAAALGKVEAGASANPISLS